MPAHKKDPSTRARRNKAATAATIKAPMSGAGPAPTHLIPPMPKRPDRRRWTAPAQELWNDFWTSPLATQVHSVDRHSFGAFIEIVDAFWRAGTPTERRQLSAEWRAWVKEYGLTPKARLSLEWSIELVDLAQQTNDALRGASATGVQQPTAGEDPRRLFAVT